MYFCALCSVSFILYFLDLYYKCILYFCILYPVFLGSVSCISCTCMLVLSKQTHQPDPRYLTPIHLKRASYQIQGSYLLIQGVV